ncbi:MAG: hypothetical protein WA876_11680 [Candidatus Acidiferrales bacterium]
MKRGFCMPAHRHAVIFLPLFFLGWLTILAPRTWGQLPSLDAYGGRTDITCPGTPVPYWTVQKVGTHWYFCTPVTTAGEGGATVPANTTSHAFFSNSVGSILPNCSNQSACTSTTTPNAAGYNTNAIYAIKYANGSTDPAGVAYNWSWQVLKRITGWDFNSIGQDSGSQVFPFDTCNSCGWPGGSSGKQPIPLPYISEDKPAEYASYNEFNFLSSCIKDMLGGVNTFYGGYRGGATYDSFDPELATEWTDELAASNTSVENLRNNYPFVLALYTDDSDYFTGSGAGPDFISGNTNANGAFITLITSPVQTYSNSTAEGGKKVLYPNTLVYAKALATNPASCSISSPCSLRDFLWCEYTLCGTRSNATGIADLDAAWGGANYTSFDSTGSQSPEVTPSGCTNSCIGNGSTTTFTGTLTANISPFSVKFFVGGTLEIGDCPAFATHFSCSGSAGTGNLFSPTTNYVTASSINYSTGAVTLTFVTAPAAGVSITASYIYNGWMAGGTGLMDEDGSNTAWVGTNSWCLENNPNSTAYFVCVGSGGGLYHPAPNANAQLGADLDAWVAQYSAEYFKVITAGLAAQNVKIPYFGLDSTGSWSTPPIRQYMQGEAPYVNGMEITLTNWSQSAGETNAMYQYYTEYMGDIPFITFNVIAAQADSSYFGAVLSSVNNFATQAIRGNNVYADMQYLLTTPSYYGDIPFVGYNFWDWQDFQTENQGLVSLNDNAYDGSEALAASVACDSNYTVDAGAMCGSEVVLADIPSWAASTAYVNAQCVQPTTPNGFAYCSQANSHTGTKTSGATQPSFSSCVTTGCTLTDDDITWENVPVPTAPYGNSITETNGIEAANLLWLGGTPGPTKPTAPSKKAAIWGYVKLPESPTKAVWTF